MINVHLFILIFHMDKNIKHTHIQFSLIEFDAKVNSIRWK